MTRHCFALLVILASNGHAQTVPSVQSENARYDLAGLVKRLMLDRDPKGFRGDYIALKSVIGPLQQVTEADLRKPDPEYFPGNASNFFYIYETRIPLYARGRRLLAENMSDQYQWKVFVAGPRAMPTNIYIRSQWPVAHPAGASYFTSHGLTLDPIVCEKLGGSEANYNAVYKVRAPGKHPLLLTISKSTGSGGVRYSYEVTWFSISAASLPREAEVGLCQVSD